MATLERYILLITILFAAQACSDDNEFGAMMETVRLENDLTFGFYTNVGFGSSGNYSNLILYVHGAEMNGLDHYNWASQAISTAGLSGNTIVVSPQYENTRSIKGLYWDGLEWKDGDRSINGVPKSSAYDVIDAIVNEYVTSFGISNVLIAGHSAGGQLTVRYSLLSDLPEILPNVEINYMPMNPSSYAYIGPERWNSASREFEVPDASDCRGYNSWNYGLVDIEQNQYNREITAEEIQSAFPMRRVTYAVGTRDLSNADNSCEASFLGDSRYERGLLAYDFINFIEPDNIHALVEVEGVAHNGNAMINSPEIINYLSDVFN